MAGPFNFSGAYTPPAGAAVDPDFTVVAQYADAAGVEASGFGTASVANVAQSCTPDGINSLAISANDVSHYTRRIYPPSMSYLFSDGDWQAINMSIAYILPVGFDTVGFGTHDFGITYYTKPAGDSISFVFGTPYTQPVGSAVSGDFAETVNRRYIQPAGIDSLGMGTMVAYWAQYVWSATVGQHDFYGVPTVEIIDLTQHYQPSGWDSSAVGTATVGPHRIAPAGIDSAEYGLPHDVDYEIRYRFLSGIDDLTFGTQVIGTRQYVYPLGNTLTQFGTPTYGHHVAYDMLGFDSLEIGAPIIDYVRVLPVGMLTTEYGTPHARNVRAYVSPLGLPPAGVGNHAIYNARSYILPAPFTSETDLAGGATEYGTGWTITGPDGPIAPLGLEFLRFGYTNIANTGVALLPAGIVPPDFPTHEITHWIQYVAPVGTNEFQGSSLLMQVRNAAIAAYPVGFDSLAGLTIVDIKDARQTAYVLQPALTEYGTPMIAYRIRTVTVLPISDPERLPKPVVYLTSVQQEGIDSLRTGLPIVTIHFNIAAPFGIPPIELLPNPLIRNRNRELPITGETHTQFGVQRVWTNKLQVTGFDTLVFSPSTIADRTGHVLSYGWESLRAYPFLVRHDPEPPVQQSMYPYEVATTVFGFPSLAGNAIRPVGFNSLDAGSGLEVFYMGAFPKGWIDTDLDGNGFGTPIMVYDQVALVSGIEPDQFQVAEPQLWPHYIVAPYPFAVDELLRPPKGVGRPYVDYFNRYVTMFPTDVLDRYGTPTAQLRDRRVYPTGISQFRYGLPKMGGGVSAYDAAEGATQTEYGDTTIEHIVPYSPYVFPPSFDSPQFGATEITLKNRQVYPLGVDSFVPGPMIDYDVGANYTPLAYGPADGIDGTVWGPDTFIAYRNREFQMVGWDSLNQRTVNERWSRVTKNPPGTTPVHALR